MRKPVHQGIITRLLALLGYLVVLLYVTGFQWKDILDIKSFVMVGVGMILLSIPQGLAGWYKLRQNRSVQPEETSEKRRIFITKEFARTLSFNAMAAAAITAVMMLLVQLKGEIEPELVIREIALGLRPILYGLVFYVLFHREEDEEGTDYVTSEQEVLTSEQEVLTPEQLCYFFRAKGLTAREAEVARLLYQGDSNREIAAELYIAETTVKKHVTHILEKLKIEQRGQIREIVAEGLKTENKRSEKTEP